MDRYGLFMELAQAN